MAIKIYEPYVAECAKTGERYCRTVKIKGKAHQVCDGPYDPKKAGQGFSYTCPYLSDELVRAPVKQNAQNLSGIQMKDFFVCKRPEEK